ncbi:MAG: T9SS type A sorting domain-containing protein [Bacteroidales bacterium]|nr:T9SS type A sorting domain-containing protein [Bacteroidales bacterium]
MKTSNITTKLGLMMLAFLFFTNKAHSDISPGDTIHAVKYLIDLQEVDMVAKTITANTTITLNPLVDNLDIFQLQLMQLTVDSVFVDQIKITNFTHEDEILNIPLMVPVSPGDTTDVKVYYHGQPFHESWGGFHYSGSYAFNLGVGISWIPHNLGKTWFPCIDDFTDRAIYEVKATVPEDMMAIGGGQLLEVTNNGNGTHTFRWLINNPIPTYLASIAIGDYALVEDTYNGIERDIPITYYVRPSDTIKVPGSFTRMHDIIALFEDKFGAYDWHRVGYVGTAIGAMEHATNIAYPHGCISNNSQYEYLYAHELSHMWFGDKVTCDKAEEMWINEGWATFCENYYVEVLDGPSLYKVQMRNMHADVLYSCHTEEGGYQPLNNIPQEYTYGTSAYDKGATVVQALRAYLGDDIFFDACKGYLEDLAFTSLSSYDMEAVFSQNTGIDMSGFFNNWVYHGGTPHYSIDSFSIVPQTGTSEVTVYVKQKRKGPAFMGDDNIIEINILDEEWHRFTDTIHFSGETGYTTMIVPFNAVEVFLDLEEKYMDATVDNYTLVKETGETAFPDTYFNIDVSELTDSAFIQATHNYAPADTFAIPVPDLRVSDYRYWTIKGVFPEPFTATGRFFYSKSGLDNTLIISASDSIVIFYRRDAGMEWEAVDFTVVGPWSIGYIYVDNLQMGDYTLGVWDISVSTEETNMEGHDNIFKAFPNPSSGKFNFAISDDNASRLEIYSFDGKLLEQIELKDRSSEVSWIPGNIPDGTYIAVLRSNNKKALASKKIVYIK